MKILYIITQADGGGAQNYTLMLAKHFGGRIASGSEAQKLFEDAEKLTVPYFKLKYLKRNIHPIYDILALFEIISLIKKQQPDIIHLNSSKAGFIGSLAGKFAGVKIIFTAHGFIFNEPFSALKKNFYVLMEKFASLFRNYIICVSQADESSALEHKLISPKKLSVVHNGIGKIDFLSNVEARQALGLANNRFIVGCVANFYKTKGVDVLITAVSKLDAETKAKALFVLVGHGPEFENLELEIKNLQLENSIKTLGKIDSVAKYLRAFDCLVLPSRKEGFPLTLLEALQAGLPIVATKVGGNPEALGDAGMLVEAENPNALAQVLVQIMNNDTIRADFSKKALEQAKLFTADKMLQETEKVYQLVLKN